MKNKLIILYILLCTLGAYAQEVPPVLSNFRVEANQKSRVYFDSSQPITGKSVAGIKISDRTITGLKLNTSTTGHYFTVSKDFTFWDNNTIRYENGSDLKNENSIPLQEFNLEYIDNNISEPDGAGNIYYVSLDGSNNDSGTNTSTSWRTITYAASKVKAGDVVYIKAGDYGAEKVSVKNNGTAANPIKFIGYKENPGDKPRLNRSQNTKFSSSEMPYIHSSSKDGSGFAAIDKKYIIIRNLQVEGYKHTVDIAKSSYCIVDNVYARGGKTNINDFPHYKSIQNRVINSYVSNGSHNGVYMTGARHLIENVYATSNGKPNMDYYIVIVGGNVGIGEHIIRNCEVLRDLNDTHPGHGISLKAQGRDIGYSLVETSTIRNVGMSLEARHSGSRNNVYKDLFITNEGSKYGKGIQITSAQNSVFERIHVENKSYGIKFLGSTEDPDAKDAGNNNLIRNCIFNDNSVNIQVIEDLDGQNRVPKNNLIANCTFNDAGSMFLFEANEKGQNNTIINSVLNEIKSEFHKNSNSDSFQFLYSNFYSSTKSFWSSKVQSGQGNMSKDPKFENISKSDFRLKASSPLIDKGKRIKEVKSDFHKNSRPQGQSSDIGAFEYNDSSTSYIDPDAGPDQLICIGEQITLVASGGNNYKWSTGETSKEIQVSPESTTIYTVIVNSGNASGSDEVTVNVVDIQADAGQDRSITKGDEITLTASGAKNYIWSNGMTGSSISVSPDETTVYTVTASEGDCQSTDEITVSVSDKVQVDTPTVVANAGLDRTICIGETVVLSASGGSTYLWSTGARTKSIEVSPNESSKYIVTVSEGSVTDTDEVLVEVISVKANAGNDVSINQGESVKLSASGGTDYLWSNGARTSSIVVQPSNTQIYSVQVSIGNCSDEDKVEVKVLQQILNPSSSVIDAGEDQTICFGESLTLNAQGANNYQWSTGENGNQIVVNPLRTETYNVTTVLNGVTSSDSVTITVENCDSGSADDNSFEGDLSIQLFPNPTSGIIKIQSSTVNSDTDMHLINMNGKILYQETLKSQQGNFGKQLDLSNYTKGIYFLRFFSDQEQLVKKIVLI